MTTVSERPEVAPQDTRTDRVVAAARRAWQVHGEPINVFSTATGGPAVTSLAATCARRVEFVVEEDDPAVWQALTDRAAADSWQLCALVPLTLLGVAHDRLRGHGFELQGWWLNEGEVSFGAVEVA